VNSVFLRKAIFPILFTLIALFFQGTVLKFIHPELAAPNLPLILVVFLGFFDATVVGALIAFVVGLLVDFFSGVLLGPTAASFVVVFGILAISTKLFIDSALASAIAVFFCTLLSSLIYAALSGQFSSEITRSFGGLLLEALFTALLAPVFFPIFKRYILVRERISPRSMTRKISRPTRKFHEGS
jgi:rod shape-determining protein MreD